MDAFAITGVSPEHDWFRVQAAVGGVESPARLFPRIHVVTSADIADLASGGRTIYFQQSGSENPLVPLASDDAAAFDPLQVPLEEIPDSRSRRPRPTTMSRRCCPSRTPTSLTGRRWTSSSGSKGSAGCRRTPAASWG